MQKPKADVLTGESKTAIEKQAQELFNKPAPEKLPEFLINDQVGYEGRAWTFQGYEHYFNKSFDIKTEKLKNPITAKFSDVVYAKLYDEVNKVTAHVPRIHFPKIKKVEVGADV